MLTGGSFSFWMRSCSLPSSTAATNASISNTLLQHTIKQPDTMNKYGKQCSPLDLQSGDCKSQIAILGISLNRFLQDIIHRLPLFVV